VRESEASENDEVGFKATQPINHYLMGRRWCTHSGCFCGLLRSKKKDKASKSRTATQATRFNPRVTDQTLTVANSLPVSLEVGMLMHCDSGRESGLSTRSLQSPEPSSHQVVELPPEQQPPVGGAGVATPSSESTGTRAPTQGCIPASPDKETFMRRLSSLSKRLSSSGRISLDCASPSAPAAAQSTVGPRL
jgi:hypothetical protein